MLHRSDNPDVLNSADSQIQFGNHPNHHRPCDRIKFRVFSSIFSKIFLFFHMGEDFLYGKQRLKFSKLISRYGPQRYFYSYICSEGQFLLSQSLGRGLYNDGITKFGKFPGIRENIFDSGHETKLSKFFVDDFAATKKIFDQVEISFENDFRIF